MSCTLEKVLSDARTLLERLKEHDTAAESLIEQSGALSQRIHSMKEVGNALPDKVYLNLSPFYCQSNERGAALFLMTTGMQKLVSPEFVLDELVV